MGIRWHLRLRMAEKGMFQTSDLVPLLAERGVQLSREQVFRLVTQIAGLLAGMLPGLREQAALAAAGRAAGNVPACQALLEHLRRNPDALGSGSSAAPLSLIRLAHALAAAGAEEVVLPGCAGCGKVTADM